MTDIAINGRFLTQPRTGVQRYAFELLKAWAAQSAGRRATPPQIFVPVRTPGASAVALAQAYTIAKIGRLSGHLWEQIELARCAPERLLVNLCNTGPLGRENQLVAIHDAAVWRHPEAYGRRFRLLYKSLLPRVARRSRRLVTVSKFSAGELKSVLGLGPRRIDIVPNGGDHILKVPADSAALPRHGLEDRRFLLAVGSANPAKNLSFLRCLEELLSARGLVLAIAGGRMERVFSARGGFTSTVIRPLGYVTDGELRALYQSAVGLVFPSLYEGFGIPPVEAMFCGCPVLASNAAAIPEVCGDGARYFDPRDPQALVDLTRTLIASEALRGDLAEAGRARANRFKWAQSAAAFGAAIAD